MMPRKNHRYYWPAIIIMVGIAIITYKFQTKKKPKNDISFSCTSEIQSSVDMYNKQWGLNGIIMINTYQNGILTLSAKGKVNHEAQEYTISRRLFFNFTSSDRHSGSFILRFINHKKNPDDNSPDNVDYIFFDAYQGIDNNYRIKQVNEKMVIFGDNFSPDFACIINNID
ncbi:hypothetical protein RJ498_003257 [Pluralibacter gergoviae]